MLCFANLQAATTFTYTATVSADNATLGFMTGDLVSYSITLTENSITPYNDSADYFYGWFDEAVSENVDMYSSISGSGLDGTWTRPVANNAAPFSFIETNDPTHVSLPNTLKLGAAADSGSTGLSINGYAVTSIYFQLSAADFDFETVGTEPDINEFFSAYNGVYSHIGANNSDILTSGGGTLSLTLNTVTITSSSVIPEPSSYGAIVGVASLACVSLRRRKRA